MSEIISRYMKDNWIISHFHIVYFLNRLWRRLDRNSVLTCHFLQNQEGGTCMFSADKMKAEWCPLRNSVFEVSVVTLYVLSDTSGFS